MQLHPPPAQPPPNTTDTIHEATTTARILPKFML
jgi:hypothetical protein